MKKTVLLTLLLFSCSFVFSNTSDSYFIKMGTGAATGRFRDMATSPLFYSGNIFVFSTGLLKSSWNRESSFIFRYGFGNHTNKYNNTFNTASLYNLDFLVSRLFLLQSVSSHKVKVFAGGTMLSSTNFRNNSALMNNSFGVENITNLMISSKISAGFRRRCISTTISAGILNLNYRPGYAYNYLPAIKDTKVRNLTEHTLSLNGFRINAQTDYTTYIRNGNGFRISYIFDAYNAPGKHEPFSHSRHSVQLTLLLKFR